MEKERVEGRVESKWCYVLCSVDTLSAAVVGRGVMVINGATGIRVVCYRSLCTERMTGFLSCF
jgi:hypothetical protein